MENLALPLPLPPLDTPDEYREEKRLWIGNLDQRLTEYQLLKILQPFGKIEKFDLLFHRSGPLEGQPRGYAFVTYDRRQCAIKAMDKLNGLQLGLKPVVVKWAHSATAVDKEQPKVLPDIPALSGAKKDGVKNASATIQAIEAKLRTMENCSEVEIDFSANPVLAGKSTTAASKNKGLATSQPRRDRRYDHNRSQPYLRHKRR